MNELKGKVALLTGSSGNLGRSWRAALEQAGAWVYCFDLANGVDVLNARHFHDALAACPEVPHVLVCAAGIDAPPGSSVADFNVMTVNYFGTLNACSVIGTAMVREQRGSIITIGSLYAGVAPGPIYPNGWVKPPTYGASKAAVVALTRHLAVRWAPFGVRVNALSPGGVQANQDPEFVRKYCERVPMGRMATVEDTIGPLLFLASDASRYVTGQELVVDGGYSSW